MTEAINDDPILLHQLHGLKDSVHDVCWDPKANKVTAASNDSSVYLWDLGHTNIRAYKFCGHSDAVTGVAFSPSGQILASCSRDKMVRLWENGVEGRSTEFKGHTSAVRSVDFSPNDNGSRILTGSEDKTAKLWTVARSGQQSHRFVRSFTGHTNWVRSAKFSPDGDLIATSSDDKTIRLWDPDTGKEIHVFSEPKGYASQIDWHPSGNCIGVASTDKSVKVYDIRMFKLQQLYTAHQGPVSQVSFHSNGNYLLSGSEDGSLKIFDLLEARPIYDLLGHKGSVTAVQFSPKGDYMVSGESNNMVYVWKTNFDLIDKELRKVAPSTQKQPSDGMKYSDVSLETFGQTRTALKEQSKTQAKLASLSIKETKNKENEPISDNRLTKGMNKSSESSNSEERLAIVVQEELGKMNSKLDTLMKTLILMEKRLSLVEDQVKLCMPQNSSPSDT